MNKQDVIDFFDRLAPTWDEGMIHDDRKISAILKNAGVTKGVSVLDVACGTGVLIPDYFKAGAGHVTAVDFSSGMIKTARPKFTDEINSDRLELVCTDVEDYSPDTRFDCILVYNAFPHFPDGDRLIAHLASLLSPGGTLSVAHGMSRDAINAHHSGRAKAVSVGLMSETELAEIFSKYLKVTTVISNSEMYQVAGTKIPQ
ncbi:MAG: methyltransferase domain-containing protein [Lachnospiraceae bacterium]|nr:methyltransferase domain-containing protein [Lachnospiraceae bacterium]